MKQTYVLMELNSVSPEPGATIQGTVLAHSRCKANTDSKELMLPSGVIKNYEQLYQAFNVHFELQGIEGDPVLTTHVCFDKAYTDKHETLLPYVCATATLE